MEELIRITTKENVVRLEQTFDFNGHVLELYKNESHDVLFVARQICNVLELANTGMALAGLDDDEKLTSTLLMSGQNRDVAFITESGFYSFVLRSNKPEAKAFKKWVTSVVLPSIRKTGSFVQKELSRKELAQMIIQVEEEKEQLALQLDASLEIINEMVPKVEYAEKVLLSESDITTTSIASELGMSAIALNKKLASLGVQRKHDKKWILYSTYQGNGYTTTRTYPFTAHDGTQKTEIHTVWTEKGREFIHWLIKKSEVHFEKQSRVK